MRVNGLRQITYKVKMPMVTIARWENGCIAEEHLFWDNAEYMKPLGPGSQATQ